MKTFTVKAFTTILAALFLSTGAIAAEEAEKDLPKTILIKKDPDGTLYVHRSNTVLDKVDKNSAAKLDQLKFEKVSSLSDVLDANSITSATAELDKDRPRQSWYVYWGYYGYYYPYYPVYYYSYAYYPYYYYGYSGCNYYWYGGGGGRYY